MRAGAAHVAYLGLTLTAIAAMAAERAPEEPKAPLETDAQRAARAHAKLRAEVRAMRDQIAHEPGGIFAPVSRSREAERRLRQQERAEAKRLAKETRS